MSVYKLITRSSIWTVDVDSKIVTRVPRTESTDHPGVPYSKVGAPREFSTYEKRPYGPSFFYRFTDVDGYWYETGFVLEGELPNDQDDGEAIPCIHGTVSGCRAPECDPHGVLHAEVVDAEMWGGTE